MLPPVLYTGRTSPCLRPIFSGYPSLGRPRFQTLEMNVVFGGSLDGVVGGVLSAEKTWGAEWLGGASQHTKITGMPISTYLWISLIHLSNIEQNEQTSPLLQSKNSPILSVRFARSGYIRGSYSCKFWIYEFDYCLTYLYMQYWLCVLLQIGKYLFEAK